MKWEEWLEADGLPDGLEWDTVPDHDLPEHERDRIDEFLSRLVLVDTRPSRPTGRSTRDEHLSDLIELPPASSSSASSQRTDGPVIVSPSPPQPCSSSQESQFYSNRTPRPTPATDPLR